MAHFIKIFSQPVNDDTVSNKRYQDNVNALLAAITKVGGIIHSVNVDGSTISPPQARYTTSIYYEATHEVIFT